MAWWCVFVAVGLAVMAGHVDAAGPGPGRMIASKEAGWPQWRGPRRDGKCEGKGLLQAWPAGGPKLLWSAPGLGFGYSCPIIAGGMIFITGEVDDELRVFALDLNGKLKWQAKNGRVWKGPYPGARGCCVYDGGRVYNMNAHGRVACFEAQDGKELWAVDVIERFEGKLSTWALAENLLIDGPRLIVTPGGRKGVMAALDKQTGRTIWASGPLLYDRDDLQRGRPKVGQDVDSAGYASPILLELAGRRQIVSMSSRHAFGVDADTGRMLWVYPLPTRYLVLAMTPALYGDGIFVTGPDSGGGALLRIHDDGKSVRVEELWISTMDTCHGGVLAMDGFFFGTWYRGNSGYGCMDARDGGMLHRTRELAMGSAIHADGRFYCLSQAGEMALVQADAKEFRIVSRFRLVEEHQNDVWAHPVILEGRMYLRYHDRLWCYDIQNR
jgi:hypothetical protein